MLVTHQRRANLVGVGLKTTILVSLFILKFHLDLTSKKCVLLNV